MVTRCGFDGKTRQWQPKSVERLCKLFQIDGVVRDQQANFLWRGNGPAVQQLPGAGRGKGGLLDGIAQAKNGYAAVRVNGRGVAVKFA